MELKEIEEYVKKELSEERFFHSQGVMKKSIELAKRFGADIDIAAKIGMAHDVAKEIPEEEKIKYCEENNIKVDEIEKLNIGLLHAKIGKDIAIKKFGFSESMGQAIANHTTGNKDMDIYSKILFIADRISEDRGCFENLDKIEELAKNDIDETVLFILNEKINLQIKKEKLIHLDGIIARNYMLEQVKNKK